MIAFRLHVEHWDMFLTKHVDVCVKTHKEEHLRKGCPLCAAPATLSCLPWTEFDSDFSRRLFPRNRLHRNLHPNPLWNNSATKLFLVSICGGWQSSGWSGQNTFTCHDKAKLSLWTKLCNVGKRIIVRMHSLIGDTDAKVVIAAVALARRPLSVTAVPVRSFAVWVVELHQLQQQCPTSSDQLDKAPWKECFLKPHWLAHLAAQNWVWSRFFKKIKTKIKKRNKPLQCTSEEMTFSDLPLLETQPLVRELEAPSSLPCPMKHKMKLHAWQRIETKRVNDMQTSFGGVYMFTVCVCLCPSVQGLLGQLKWKRPPVPVCGVGVKMTKVTQK